MNKEEKKKYYRLMNKRTDYVNKISLIEQEIKELNTSEKLCSKEE